MESLVFTNDLSVKMVDGSTITKFGSKIVTVKDTKVFVLINCTIENIIGGENNGSSIVLNNFETLHLINCTIKNNRGKYFGGVIYAVSNLLNSTIIIENSIIF